MQSESQVQKRLHNQKQLYVAQPAQCAILFTFRLILPIFFMIRAVSLISLFGVLFTISSLFKNVGNIAR